MNEAPHARREEAMGLSHSVGQGLEALLLGLMVGILPMRAMAQDDANATPSVWDSVEEPEASPESTPEPEPDAETRSAAVERVPVAAEDEDEAQVAPEGAAMLDVIQVTADKRVKSQRDIPGSVGAIRGKDLEDMRAQSMRDYLKLVPGVSYADQGNEESMPVIRGITTDTSFGPTPATTGVYLDDMPFADLFFTLSIPDLNPFDLDRVEVLKGPQGTLFGSGALAGAVRYIMHRPDHGIWQGKLMHTVTSNPFSEKLSPVTAAAVNVPLFGDAVALRAVGVYRRDNGTYDAYVEDTNGNVIRDDVDADKTRQASWRYLASWNPTDRLKLSGFFFKQFTHSDDIGAAVNQQEEPRSENIFPFPSPRDHNFSGGNLLATYEFDWGQLLSSTNILKKYNWNNGHAEFGGDPAGNRQNDAELFNIFGNELDGYTQEFRASSPDDGGPWQWLAGASFLHYSSVFWQYFTARPDERDPTHPHHVSQQDRESSQVFNLADQLGKEAALFGEVTGRLSERWEVTLGARSYRTQLFADTEICGVQVLAFFQEPCNAQHYEDTETGVNPKFSVRYLHNQHVQWYALAAKGFQFGGIQVNGPAPGFPESAEQAGYSFGPYKSSTLWNYESGMRTEWLGRRLRFDVTAFYLDWTDLQLTVLVPLLMTSAQYALIVNVGRAHSRGIETSLEVAPFAGARWTSTAVWMDARTDTSIPSPTGGEIPAGSRLPGSPKFQWANVLSYQTALPWPTGWEIGPVLTHSFNGTSVDKLQPTGTIGGYSTVDARITATKPDSRFLPEIALGVTNLTDVRGVGYHLRSPPHEFYHFIPPRTLMLSVGLRY